MADFTLGSKLRHPAYGEGVVIDISELHYRIYFREHGDMELGKAFDGFQLLEAGKGGNTLVPLEDAVEALKNIFDMYYDVTEHVDLGDRWTGGQLILQPKDTSLKPKEISIESFFHKIVMLRDRLRVMEQKINANAKLTDADKVEMQQYITRIYGSLTTFNVLFKAKKDWFVGESGKQDDNG